MGRSPSLLPVLIAALVATAVLPLSPASAAKCHPDDKKALLAIKRFWKNPSYLASWEPSIGCCAWNGVACDSPAGRVTDLTISDDANITGAIPPVLADLLFLRRLDIRKLPNLKGPIPSTLARLRNLTFLRLEGNGLSGPVPAFLSQLPELWLLDLRSNRLTGSIPAALGGLPKLQYLALEHNQLTGPVPAELGKLQAEAVLLLSHNSLYGPLPPALGAVDFAVVDLSFNHLSADPTFLFGQHKMELNYVDLSSNMFEFDLGRVVFPTYAELHWINVSHNMIYGRIPEQIANVTDLVKLDLSYNRLSGEIPKRIANLTELLSLDLSYNRLCGEIPTGGNLDEFKAEVYAHNRCLCGKPLPPCK